MPRLGDEADTVCLLSFFPSFPDVSPLDGLHMTTPQISMNEAQPPPVTAHDSPSPETTATSAMTTPVPAGKPEERIQRTDSAKYYAEGSESKKKADRRHRGLDGKFRRD